MGFRLVPKSVTLHDLERRNGRYLRDSALFTVYFSSMYSRCDLSNEIFYMNIWIRNAAAWGPIT